MINKKKLARRLPVLGVLWRKWMAAKAYLSKRQASYSQHEEDNIIAELLPGISPEDGIYIDVGANHPSTISNTYLFYRKGYSGVVIEPNQELIRLHRWIRPRDTQVEVGCGEKARLATFHLSKTPVLSSFREQQYHGGEDWKTIFLPILTLDQVMQAIPEPQVLFLNIDVEGLDLQVLQGAEKTLERTRLVCIEANEPAEEKAISLFMESRGWQLKRKQACNLFFQVV